METLLDNADKSKYGSVVDNLGAQKSLKNDQYPRTIVAVNYVLSNHSYDKQKPKVSEKKSLSILKLKKYLYHLLKWKESAIAVGKPVIWRTNVV